MASSNIKLGDKVKDTISGFTGIVTGEFKYLNGCVRLQLDPDKLDKDGKVQDGRIFDIEQLALVKAGVHAVKSPSGGPRDNPAQRSNPSR
ncbi:MAG: hypothetical protein Q8M26_08910 [Pseudolabrys sp.]|nr:hypothetical protein [Pseudolabrys sp.]